jgi:hypothetical protein
MKKFIDQYIYPLTVIVTCVLGGYVVRFELLASEVSVNTDKINSVKEKTDLLTWLACEDAIEKGKDEAKERCKQVLREKKDS